MVLIGCRRRTYCLSIILDAEAGGLSVTLI
jgi:hypothetical protein